MVEAHGGPGQLVVLRRRMTGRDPDEPTRTSTPLELLFDLCYVVAVSNAALELHHAVSEGHAGPGVGRYALVFFAIWWGWVNFTWFASAYDTDDVPYRLLTLLQMAGVLVFALGIHAAMTRSDFTGMVAGYVVMRVAMVGQWLRAAREHPEGRPAALRYALGVGLVQVAWLAWLAVPAPAAYFVFGLLALVEVAVPAWAEFRGTPTSWHPEHIAERYGLFTIIVLGEAILGTVDALGSALERGHLPVSMLLLGIGALLIVFGLWWAYFKTPTAEGLRGELRTTFGWAYGHYVVFGGIAALGAGFGVAVDTATHHSEVAPRTAALAVAVPLVAVVLVLTLLQGRLGFRGPGHDVTIVVGAVVILGLAFAAAVVGLGLSVLLMGITLTTLVALSLLRAARAG
jgi:low temperature requirement protein LtrA